MGQAGRSRVVPRGRPPTDGAGLTDLATVITEGHEVDMVTRGRAYLESLAGRRVTVVGLARSGVAAARLLRAVGAQVTGIDVKPLEALGREAAALQTLGVRLLTGKETRGAFDGADLVVVSPGVPLDGDQLRSEERRVGKEWRTRGSPSH